MVYVKEVKLPKFLISYLEPTLDACPAFATPLT